MSYTVENQRRVLVHRDMPGKDEGNFLLIKKENLYAAYRDLNATALCLYLYLAGNKDGFDLAFSPKAIRNEMGLPESTCRDQFKVLVYLRTCQVKCPRLLERLPSHLQRNHRYMHHGCLHSCMSSPLPQRKSSQSRHMQARCQQ